MPKSTGVDNLLWHKLKKYLSCREFLNDLKEYTLGIRDEKQQKNDPIFTVFETRIVSYDHTRKGFYV